MKLLISQHFSRNKGNVSLLYTFVEALRENLPSCNITVASFDPEVTRSLFGYQTCEWPFQTRRLVDAHGWRRLLLMLTESWRLVAQCVLAYLVRFSFVTPESLPSRYDALRQICNTDLLVSPGGHLFTTFNPFPGVFAHFFPCLLAVIVRVRYVVIAQTIGPFFGFWKWPCRWLTRFVVEHAAEVTVRDDNSLETITACRFKVRSLKRLNELVFLYPEKDSITGKVKTNSSCCIGVTFHHIYYKRWMNRDEYIGRMVQFLNLITGRYDLRLKFVSMEDSAEGRGDLSLLQEIRRQLNTPENVEIVDLPMDPRELLDFFGKMDFVIATKTHSVVYGLRQCIPTLAIAYDRKTFDFMRDFGQFDYAIALSSFDPKIAFKRFEHIVENFEFIRNELKKHLIVVQRQSLENIFVIKKNLSKNQWGDFPDTLKVTNE